jgi:hypothetical protein
LEWDCQMLGIKSVMCVYQWGSYIVRHCQGWGGKHNLLRPGTPVSFGQQHASHSRSTRYEPTNVAKEYEPIEPIEVIQVDLLRWWTGAGRGKHRGNDCQKVLLVIFVMLSRNFVMLITD